MQMETSGSVTVDAGVLPSLAGIAAAHGLADLAVKLEEVQAVAAIDLASCARELDAVRGESLVQRSARHLLSLGGKRLRPLCVSLCARLGRAPDRVVQDLAIAAELVHSATLLHDDVVDVGDTRRGWPTARTIYGNAASVFAGDWLLVDALRRVRAHDLPGTLESLLATIDEMIAAESLQLEGRGKLRLDRDSYFRVVRGKTAALFRWACAAGARAGGLGADEQEALGSYGEELGLAFQLIDDLLDLAGDPARTGKKLFADLHEGKATYPLIVLLEREPDARPLIEALVAQDEPSPSAIAALRRAVERTDAVQACRELAVSHADRARTRLARFDETPAREALFTLVLAAVHRDR
jgi:octaprenyl-diphosphate synthase